MLVIVLVVEEVELVEVDEIIEDDSEAEENENEVNANEEDGVDDKDEVVVNVVGAAVGTLLRNAGSALFAMLCKAMSKSSSLGHQARKIVVISLMASFVRFQYH